MTHQAERLQTMEEVSREHFIKVLKACNGNRRETARVLDIAVRTVTTLVRKYGLNKNPQPSWLAALITTDGKRPTDGPTLKGRK